MYSLAVSEVQEKSAGINFCEILLWIFLCYEYKYYSGPDIHITE